MWLALIHLLSYVIQILLIDIILVEIVLSVMHGAVLRMRYFLAQTIVNWLLIDKAVLIVLTLLILALITAVLNVESILILAGGVNFSF